VINVEQLHSGWREAYKKEARLLLGGDVMRAAVISPAEEAEVGNCEYQCHGIIAIPDCEMMIYDMAKFCQVTLLPPDGVRDLDLQEFPEATFCLDLLLFASLPANPKTGMFRGNGVGVLVLNLEDGTIENEDHWTAAFGGLGIILMEKCRELLDPLATNEQMLAMTEDKLLVILGEKDER
jgi:hypothetical protein